MRLPPLHLLLPASLPDDPSLWQGLDLPALARLFARAPRIDVVRGEDFQRATGHERWLAERHGLDGAEAAPLAPFMLLGDGGEPALGEAWLCVEPVHVEVTRDHLRLHGPHAIALGAPEADALREAADASFTERGLRLLAPTPWRWYAAARTQGVGAAAPGPFAAASPAKASGRSVDLWLPQPAAPAGDASAADEARKTARRWLALQNEIQMVWHDHPVNDRRAPPINSVWLHGYGRYSQPSRRYARVYAAAPATRGLALASGADAADPPRDYTSLLAQADAVPASTDGAPWLIEYDAPLAATLAEDAHGWREAMKAAEREWFAPILAALADGTLPEVTLILTGDVESRTVRVGRGDLRRFWRRRPLALAVGNDSRARTLPS
ncbi:regulator [Chitinasiproducens palmae]|nr:regulator [Chitinasiproducens palmae]